MQTLSPETREEILRGGVRGYRTSIDASDAPRHMQDRIIEIRLARMEKRADPEPSPEYIAEARNYAVAARGRRPVIMPATRRRNEVSLEDQYLQQTGHEYVSEQELRMRMKRQANQLERESKQLAASQAEATRAADVVRAELFPWQN